MSNFKRYVLLKEEENKHIISKIKLQKSQGAKEFEPFTINQSTNSNLRMIVQSFLDSDKVRLNYTTIEKNKGEIQPQLKKKSLYLTGGSVRDHLKGKTPKNHNLTTDATTSEIKMILANKGFAEVKPKNHPDGEFDKRYNKLTTAGIKNKVYYASRWDKEGKEIEITVEVNGEKFEIAPLGKHSKNKNDKVDKAELAGSVEDDAQNRDFTINSMYIPLTNADGDNSDLIDPHGGAHHLKHGQVIPIGDFEKNVEKDTAMPIRFLKLLGRFGKSKDIPEKYQKMFAKAKDGQMPKDLARKEFLDGLENPDTNTKDYLNSYKKTGMLNHVFPDANADEDFPDADGDRWTASAWLLRNQDPEEIKNKLIDQGWPKREACDIAYLVKLFNWSKNKFDPDEFYDMKNTPNGLTKNKISSWMTMNKANMPMMDLFFNFDDSDVTPYVKDGEDKKINPAYSQHLGRTPFGSEFEHVKRHLTNKKWRDIVAKSQTKA